MKRGSVNRRCGCRDEDGRQYGKSCPKRRRKDHGTYFIRQELPPAQDGDRRTFRRSGYTTSQTAQSDLDKVRALLSIPEADDIDSRDRIAELLVKVSENKEPIPDRDEIARRIGTRQQLAARLTVGEWLDKWLASLRVRKSSVTRYECDIRNHLRPRIGHIRLDRLVDDDVREMFDSIDQANEEIEVANAARREVEARRKIATKRADQRAICAELRAMAPFRRTTGLSTQQRIRATLRAALNDAIG